PIVAVLELLAEPRARGEVAHGAGFQIEVLEAGRGVAAAQAGAAEGGMAPGALAEPRRAEGRPPGHAVPPVTQMIALRGAELDDARREVAGGALGPRRPRSIEQRALGHAIEQRDQEPAKPFVVAGQVVDVRRLRGGHGLPPTGTTTSRFWRPVTVPISS